MKQSELPKKIYTLITDQGELDCVCAYLGIDQARTIITAALVTVSGGEYEEVYFTEGSNFKRSAYWDWQPVSFYTDDIPDELDLQDVRDNRDLDNDYGV